MLVGDDDDDPDAITAVPEEHVNFSFGISDAHKDVIKNSALR